MNTAQNASAYGLWMLVIINSAIFIIFAFSFFKPKSRRDWRSFGSFSAFIVALFIEMYGFPLTIYLLSGWLARLAPEIDPFSHNAGHFWETVLGLKGDPHLNPIHLTSDLLIYGGLILLAAAWRVLFEAQRTGKLAKVGPYRYLRHPQYAGFIVIMIGFPANQFGEVWRMYEEETPRWFPRIGTRLYAPTVDHSRQSGDEGGEYAE
jgi:protein-S-isoprenylcysteine O-methyltransferase Ste14